MTAAPVEPMRGREILIAADEDIFDAVREALVGGDWDGSVRVVRASELEDPSRQSDLYLGRYRPSGPSRVQVLQFVNDSAITVVEQHLDSGAVYRGGQLVWPNAPLAVVNVSDGGSEPRMFSDAALYFRDGPRRRITTLPNVVWVVKAFLTRSPDPTKAETIEDDWLDIARAVLSERQTPQEPDR